MCGNGSHKKRVCGEPLIVNILYVYIMLTCAHFMRGLVALIAYIRRKIKLTESNAKSRYLKRIA